MSQSKLRGDGLFGVARGLDATLVEAASAETPAEALRVLHPTYFGTTADFAALASVCARHGGLLLADGAHSPHFAFHPDLQRPAEQSDAAATAEVA